MLLSSRFDQPCSQVRRSNPADMARSRNELFKPEDDGDNGDLLPDASAVAAVAVMRGEL